MMHLAQRGSLWNLRVPARMAWAFAAILWIHNGAARAAETAATVSPNAAKAAALGFPDFVHWPADLDPADFYPVSKVRPGMTGVGKTVFEGTRIEEFTFTVLGTAHNFYPESDLVWVRLETPRLQELGVVAGMSGSPVYIDGKMLGAVAYGYGFTKEPIAGITPIEQMIRVLSITNDKPHPVISGATASNWAEAKAVMDRWNRERTFVLRGEEAREIGLPDADRIPTEGMPIQPLGMALQLSSSNPFVINEANRLLSPMGFNVVSGGGMTGGLGSVRRVDEANREIYPEKPAVADGAALGVTLMEGSMTLSGIGTITLVHGDKLVAFGHPMMGNGAVDFPMNTAVIFGVMPSIQRPFKLGESFEVIGSIRQDRMPAIGGQLGYTTPMIPMSVKIHVPEMKEGTRTFEYNIIPDPNFAPRFAMIGWFEAVMSADRGSGPMTVESHLKVHLSRGRTLERRDFLSGDSMPVIVTAYRLVDIIGNLLSNPYEIVKIDKIEVEATIRQRLDMGIVTDVRLDRDAYRPGETARLRLWTQRWREGMTDFEFPIQIPADLEDGDYQLRLLDGSARESFQYQLHPELQRPMNANQLINSLEVAYPTNRLYLLITRDLSGMTFQGKELPDLPGSVQTAMRISAPVHQTLPLSIERLKEVQKAFPYEVGGTRTFPLHVSRKVSD